VTEFVFVRHGSTQNLEAGQWQGWSPVPLSALGRAQALAAATRLAGEAPTERIFSSPLVRTRQTAEIISGATGAEIEDSEALKERMTATRLWGVAHADSLEYLTLQRAHRLDAGWSYEDEEPWPSLAARIRSIVALMHERSSHGGRFLFVTHGLTLRSLRAALQAGVEAPIEEWLRAYQDVPAPECCSLTVFSADANGIQLERWNDTSHFDGAA